MHLYTDVHGSSKRDVPVERTYNGTVVVSVFTLPRPDEAIYSDPWGC